MIREVNSERYTRFTIYNDEWSLAHSSFEEQGAFRTNAMHQESWFIAHAVTVLAAWMARTSGPMKIFTAHVGVLSCNGVDDVERTLRAELLGIARGHQC